MDVNFKTGGRLGTALFEWWQGLKEDRASRAVLRRASSLTDVALTPAYQRLCRRLGASNWNEWQRDRFTLVVGVLAHVTTHDERLPAEAMSKHKRGEDHPPAERLPAVAVNEHKRGEGRPPVSELRFLRLLESPDPDALFSGVRRVLPLMGGVDVIVLANDLMHWGDEVKKRWAYGYDWPEETAR